jgi:hypothetical protein
MGTLRRTPLFQDSAEPEDSVDPLTRRPRYRGACKAAFILLTFVIASAFLLCLLILTAFTVTHPAVCDASCMCSFTGSHSLTREVGANVTTIYR